MELSTSFAIPGAGTSPPAQSGSVTPGFVVHSQGEPDVTFSSMLSRLHQQEDSDRVTPGSSGLPIKAIESDAPTALVLVLLGHASTTPGVFQVCLSGTAATLLQRGDSTLVARSDAGVESVKATDKEEEESPSEKLGVPLLWLFPDRVEPSGCAPTDAGSGSGEPAARVAATSLPVRDVAPEDPLTVNPRRSQLLLNELPPSVFPNLPGYSATPKAQMAEPQMPLESAPEASQLPVAGPREPIGLQVEGGGAADSLTADAPAGLALDGQAQAAPKDAFGEILMGRLVTVSAGRQFDTRHVSAMLDDQNPKPDVLAPPTIQSQCAESVTGANDAQPPTSEPAKKASNTPVVASQRLAVLSGSVGRQQEEDMAAERSRIVPGAVGATVSPVSQAQPSVEQAFATPPSPQIVPHGSRNLDRVIPQVNNAPDGEFPTSTDRPGHLAFDAKLTLPHYAEGAAPERGGQGSAALAPAAVPAENAAPLEKRSAAPRETTADLTTRNDLESLKTFPLADGKSDTPRDGAGRPAGEENSAETGEADADALSRSEPHSGRKSQNEIPQWDASATRARAEAAAPPPGNTAGRLDGAPATAACLSAKSQGVPPDSGHLALPGASRTAVTGASPTAILSPDQDLSGRPASAQELKLQVDSADAGRLQLDLRERNGDVIVSVRSRSEAVAEVLRSDLGELARHFSAEGIQADFRIPQNGRQERISAAEDAAGSHNSGNGRHAFDGRGNDSNPRKRDAYEMWEEIGLA